ncbi:hypothetical protein HK097_002443, partial [Rhizophlyctis rosea]
TLAVGPHYHVTGVDANGNLQFGEAAFVAMDWALALASQHDVKLIIPFINNHFPNDNGEDVSGYGNYGGFAKLLGRHWKQFFTDRVVIDTFKQLITYVLNRKNTISGVRYGDDPTILAWQTGNELGGHDDPPPPPEWTIEIARLIKHLAPRSLVSDGTLGWDNGKRRWHRDVLKAPEVDIFVNHYNDKYLERDADFVAGNGKVFVNGEFGLYLPACPYDGVLGRTIKNHNIAGSMLWSLRYHSGAGGFYTHCEGYGHDKNGGGARDRNDYYYSYHAPGFRSNPSQGFGHEEQSVMPTIRSHALRISNLPPNTPFPPLIPPQLLTTSADGSEGGGWDCVAEGVTDDKPTGSALWRDEWCVGHGGGRGWWYRVQAVGVAGSRSAMSNIVGPLH